MKYGVPHGSVLGPSLLYIYLYPVQSIIFKYPNIYYHILPYITICRCHTPIYNDFIILLYGCATGISSIVLILCVPTAKPILLPFT